MSFNFRCESARAGCRTGLDHMAGRVSGGGECQQLIRVEADGINCQFVTALPVEQ